MFKSDFITRKDIFSSRVFFDLRRDVGHLPTFVKVLSVPSGGLRLKIY